jgi:SAM-dependent methyltransferase
MGADRSRPDVSRQPPDADPWEEAYLRFHSPAQEIGKFMRRLRQLGASRWPRDAPVVELFCGRGNGLRALEGLGFTNVTGVDLSPTLASRYDGSARVLVHDCRQLPFPDATYDVAVVHGGLHHLESLPDDLERTLSETRRVLRVGGRLVAVEPWRTPFLDLVHLVSERPAARRLCPKLDAYQTMQDLEARTFNRWVSVPDVILGLLRRHFTPEILSRRWGKLHFVGRKESGRPAGA